MSDFTISVVDEQALQLTTKCFYKKKLYNIKSLPVLFPCSFFHENCYFVVIYQQVRNKTHGILKKQNDILNNTFRYIFIEG